MRIIETLKKIKFDNIDELKEYLREGNGLVFWQNINTGDRVLVTLSDKTGEPTIKMLASSKVNEASLENIYALTKICDGEQSVSSDDILENAMNRIKTFFDEHDCCHIDLPEDFEDAPIIFEGDICSGCPHSYLTSIEFEGRNFIVECADKARREAPMKIYSLDMNLEQIVDIATFLEDYEIELEEIIEEQREDDDFYDDL